MAKTVIGLGWLLWGGTYADRKCKRLSRVRAVRAEQVQSGHYANVRDIFDAAKAALAREAADDDLGIAYVRQAIEEGEASGVYEGNVFADLRAKYNLPRA